VRSLRTALAASALAAASVLTGCFHNGDEQDKPVGSLRGALSFLPADTGAVLVVPTDLDEGPLKDLDDLGRRFEGWEAFRDELESAIGGGVLDFERDVRPQLGGPLAVAIGGEGDTIASLRLRDPPALRRAVEERVREGEARRLPAYKGAYRWREPGGPASQPRASAIAEGYLVVADTESALKEALDARAGSDNLASDEDVTSELDKLGDDALARVVGDGRRLLAAGDPGAAAAAARRIPWVAALGKLVAVARVGEEHVRIAFRVETDRRRLSEDDLPLPPGPESPRLHDLDAAASLGVLEPDRLARFIEDVVEVVEPEQFAPFEAAIDQLRSAFGVDLHRDLLAKVRSLSLALAAGTAASFQARLERGTGRQVARALSRARPFVEEVLRDLVPGVTVTAQGTGAQRLYVVRQGPLPLARYGVRDDALVGSVGLADLPPPTTGRKVKGAKGALVVKADPGRLTALIPSDGIFGDSILRGTLDLLSQLGELTLSIRAETGYLSGRARLEAE
jgi:Protein of unknown function (DUF3352)